MAIFGSKKKEATNQNELPPLKFPELPKEEAPTYEKHAEINPVEADIIKQAVQPADNSSKLMPEQPMTRINPEPTYNEYDLSAQDSIPAVTQAQAPTMAQGVKPGERPLFVKIERYKDVMDTLEELKKKIKDASDVLNDLSKIKEQEDTELKTWKNDLESLKTKLVTIDKALFEL
jgi:hypothetical protein